MHGASGRRISSRPISCTRVETARRSRAPQTPGRVGEIFNLAHNPVHRWFYFPRMERDETLLFKCFDSALDGRARYSAHTAFEDPNHGTDSAPRESIELRALAMFG